MAIETKQLHALSKVYLEAVYGGAKKEAPKDNRLVVTAADKKANTKAYQNLKAGVKGYKAADHLKNEETDNSYVQAYVSELNKTTLGSYVKKASKDLSDRRFDQGDSEKRKYDPDAADDKEEKKLVQREKGISRAATKLSKEETEVTEAMSSYDRARKAAARRAADRNAARRRGEMGGRMERETYTSEGGTEMHHKVYRATPMKSDD